VHSHGNASFKCEKDYDETYTALRSSLQSVLLNG